MARIGTYSLDTFINDSDLLIGTDGGTGVAGSGGATKNFSIGALRDYIISRDDSIVGNYDTNVVTETVLDEGLQLFTAHAFYSPTEGNLMAVLPSGPDTGSWVRITTLGKTGLALFAGSTSGAAAIAANPGNRFMAGITDGGTAANDPHLLMIPAGTEASFELIYVEDEVTTNIGGVEFTAPVGWIIVN